MRTNNVSRAALLALALAACASNAPRPGTATAQRLKDSAPEKTAALRSAAPGLSLEAEDQRWGIEAAKQRKRDRAQASAPPTSPTFQTATQVEGLELAAPAPARKP